MSEQLPYLDNECRPLDDLAPEQESRLQTFFGDRFQHFGYVVGSPEDFSDEKAHYFLLVLSDALDTALSKLAAAQAQLKLYGELEKAAQAIDRHIYEGKMASDPETQFEYAGHELHSALAALQAKKAE